MKFLNSTIASGLRYVPKRMVWFLSKRYIAGESLQEAIARCKQINSFGAMCTVDYLGESIQEQEKVEEIVDIYFQVLQSLKEEGIDGNVSIKPTSFGALIDKEFCVTNIQKLVGKAHELGNFVRIDMENHPYTDFTLDIYQKLYQKFPKNIGTVLQSYMKRTYKDAENIASKVTANLRLCKGIYHEPEEYVYRRNDDINDSYLKTLDLLFGQKSYVAIATHDDILVNGAKKLIAKHGLSKNQYEFQMLLGVRSELRKKLLQEGHRLRIYVPFGVDWHSYSLRRLEENPALVGNIIKGVLTFGR